jgi:magnesium transporter
MFKIDKFIKRRSEKIGLPPGTPVYTADKKEEVIRMTVIDYNEDNFEEQEISEVSDCFRL